MDRKADTGGPDNSMEGFLSLSWHGAHLTEGGTGKDPELFVNMDVARDCIGGQFELYFCSTDCLRLFLNQCVDALEQNIREERIRQS